MAKWSRAWPRFVCTSRATDLQLELTSRYVNVGVEMLSDGSSYTGGWSEGKKHGKGVWLKTFDVDLDEYGILVPSMCDSLVDNLSI